MRKGSVAIVPIILVVALLFWAIWFMGQESDNTHVISNLEKLQNLHENAAMYAMKRKIEILEQTGKNELTDEEKAQIEQEVRTMIQKNGEE